MAGRSKTAQLDPWRKSSAFRAVARQSAKANLKMLKAAPRCGAVRKRDGKPCQKPAMGNGRCDVHGGKTPRGRHWHVVQYPDCSTWEGHAKFQRKLSARARVDAKRAARIAAMTPERRAAYDAWHLARRPGLTKAARKAATKVERERARQNAETRRLLTQGPFPPVLDPESLRLRSALATARAELARIEARGAAGAGEDQGVFG